MNKKQTTKVLIDSRARLVYASYYIKGIIDLFGSENVYFQIDPFKTLIKKYDNLAFEEFFALIVINKGQSKRIIIDYKDNYHINETIYEWCDVYGKVNVNRELTDLNCYPKLVTIGPGFGIKVWNNFLTLLKSVSHFARSYRYCDIKLYNFFYGYYWQTKRLPLAEFKHIPTDGKYIFFVSTLWTHENCIKSTNGFRAAFIESCKAIGVDFEGGFYAKQSNKEYNKYKNLVYSKFIPYPLYIQKTQKSSVVFNTPTVFNCHGWKLGEYFALGKAIISTPLTNIMPVELEHGKNIHFINDQSELKDAITKILFDNTYRAHLENGAIEYYQKYLEPSKVILKLL